jgi:hypothetical protein
MSITELRIIQSAVSSQETKVEIEEILKNIQENPKPDDYFRGTFDTGLTIKFFYVTKYLTIGEYYPETIEVQDRKKLGVVLKDGDEPWSKGQISIFKEVIAHHLRIKLEKEIKKAQECLSELQKELCKIENIRFPVS